MSRVFTGSKASLKLDGLKVAFVSNINITEENTLTDIDVLDQLEVAEHAETAHKVSFTVSLFKVDTNSAKELGLSPDNLRDILSQPELVMEVYNSVDDRVEYTITGVKWEGGSGTVDARGVYTGTWNFKGRIGRGL
ncbi:MAG: hypothetical protein MOGMAGMI_00278 [Candidatus Omnitrophica bacterium]|nr:hypothetical protein [Candidatus Omnitrophota bacterium]